MEKIKGYVEKIIFRNTENGYTVFSLDSNEDEIVCTGSFPVIDTGECVEVTGDFVMHPVYGEQLKVTSLESIVPDDIFSVERYLGSGAVKGIGPVTAKRIVDKFGDDTLRIMDEEPERLAEIKGITLKKAREIAAEQEEKKELRKAMIFLGGFGISNAMSVKIYQEYGPMVYSILRENPYQLADDILGVGFKKADEIAFKAGIKPDSKFRINACVIYTLVQAAGDGNAYLPQNMLVERTLNTLRPAGTVDIINEDNIINIEKSDIEESILDLAIDSRIKIVTGKRNKKNLSAVQYAIKDYQEQNSDNNCQYNHEDIEGIFEVKNKAGYKKAGYKKENPSELDEDSGNIPDDSSENKIYYSLYYYTERNIARMLKEINLPGRLSEEKINERIKKVEEESRIELDDMQKEAIRASANAGILIVTGGPGTGKTTTINALINYYKEDYKEIILAAPTGRAAKRMTEATGFEAKTIHRLLEISGDIEDTSSGANFNYDEDNPLEADVIIIDEMSMVDMFLMSALLRAIKPGTRLVLVGDVDQLPSVGCGNVLRDLIDSEKFKTVKLEKIFRQAEESDIVVNAHKINKGQHIELKTDSKDFIFIERDNPYIILGSILTLVRDKLPGYINADIRDIQILTPVKKGTLGVININKFLQEQLNPPNEHKNEITFAGNVFREGDKIMHIKNNYDLEWEMKTKTGFVYDRGKGIFNGDLGIITRINEHTRQMEVAFDDGKIVIYEYSHLEELTLAYACTVHKSQGSEYPAVVLPLLSGPRLLMNRNILYTAVTRAIQCVCVVGSRSTVCNMIDNEREMKRFSGLKDRILELF